MIDGTDGAGKSTQLKKLQERLKQNSVRVADIHFPQHGKPSAYFVDQYLNGKYDNRGSSGGLFGGEEAERVGAYAVSIFYALDRFDAKKEILEAMKDGALVVADRYVSSNMGHQGGKLVTKAARQKYFKWIDNIEFEVFKIPRPTLTIVLHVPAAIAEQLIGRKGAREYVGGNKKDLHEKNLQHLKMAEQVYLEIAKLFPEQYRVIECMDGGRLLSVDEIHERIWSVVAPLLGK